MSELPPAVRRVIAALAERGHAGDVRTLSDSARTAAEAADALGCTVAEIAKSIVFRRRDDDAAVVVVTSGDNRVDKEKVAELVGPVKTAGAEFVLRATGFAAGGVSPVGQPDGTVVVVDRDLLRFERVWAAAGHTHHVFDVSPAQLVEWSGRDAADVRVD